MAVDSPRRASASGPVVWWLRNDLRLADNPVARKAVGEALTDGRELLTVFIFDPRFLDRSLYGRVTDPQFKKSIPTRKPVDFGNRKCNALRARFWLQCVRAVADGLAAKGGRLLVCHGRPEEVLAALPEGATVLCQQEPVSPEQLDVEDNVEAALSAKNCALLREWGAMSLYHREDLPFALKENEIPKSYTELGNALGWDDIWSLGTRCEGATPVRPPLAAPAKFPAVPEGVVLPGLMPPELLADEAAALRRLGYTDAEVEEALGQTIPAGGEPAARALFRRWLAAQTEQTAEAQKPQSAVFWDLPVGNGPGEGHDALQWANLSRPDGWMRISHYMAVGCISAREMFAEAALCRNFTGMVHRFMWREFHRLRAIKFGRRLFWLQGPAWVERPWSWDTALVEAWKQGRTGVPYIDACMRELRKTGWLAYKGRKTSGFFLVFGLGVDWRVGAFWFEEVLLDYDVAMNYGNWVVVAQVDKLGSKQDKVGTLAELVDWRRGDIELKLSAEMANDPTGAYIRRWVPELASVADEHVHMPWVMTQEDMASCGCVLGKDYPAPLMQPLHLFVNKTQQKPEAEEKAWENEERRVHAKDARTHHEFLEWARRQGESDERAQEMWAEAVPLKRLRELGGGPAGEKEPKAKCQKADQ